MDSTLSPYVMHLLMYFHFSTNRMHDISSQQLLMYLRFGMDGSSDLNRKGDGHLALRGVGFL